MIFKRHTGKRTHIFSESCLEVMPRVGSLLLPSVDGGAKMVTEKQNQSLTNSAPNPPSLGISSDVN